MEMTPKRLLNISLWFIVVLLLTPLYLRLAWIDPVDYHEGGLGTADFKAYYIASRLLARGQNIYDTDLQQEESAASGYPPDATFYLYPSILATALLPLRDVPLPRAALIWNTLNLFMLIITLWLLTSVYGLRTQMGAYYPLFIILFLLAAPTIVALRVGQANVATLLLIAAVMAAENNNRPFVTGVSLAVSVLLKLFPGVLVLWLWKRRRYRAIGWAASVGAILLILNAVVLWQLGNSPLLDWHYLTRVLPNLSPPSMAQVQSLAGFVAHFHLGSTAHVLLSLLLLILATTAYLRKGVHPELRVPLLLATVLLLAGITWTSTLILLAIPFIALYRWWSVEAQPLALAFAALSYILVNGTRITAAGGASIAGNPWLSSLPFFGLLLCWIGLIVASFSWRMHAGYGSYVDQPPRS